MSQCVFHYQKLNPLPVAVLIVDSVPIPTADSVDPDILQRSNLFVRGQHRIR